MGRPPRYRRLIDTFRMGTFALLAIGLAGCAVALPDGVSVSEHRSNDGWLRNGQAIADQGPGYIRARRGEPTRFGLPRLVAAIERAAADVATEFPGGPPLRVGDLSSPRGGRHPRHGSHRSGRDVDLIYYATDLHGAPVPGRGWVAYDRFGVGVESEEHGGRVLRFDDARNWALVRSFLAHEPNYTQWIFTSRGIKARLLRYAAAHERDPEILMRARAVLHQPTRGNPHADHFHVRIACGADQVAMGCRDRGPVWPWFADRSQKRDEARPALNDEALLRLMFADLPPTTP